MVISSLAGAKSSNVELTSDKLKSLPCGFNGEFSRTSDGISATSV